MKISQEVREYASGLEQDGELAVQMLDDPLEGMQQKADEFRLRGVSYITQLKRKVNERVVFTRSLSAITDAYRAAVGSGR